MDAIKHQELLLDMKAAEYGQLQRKDKQKLHNKVAKKAYPFSYGKGRALTTKEAAGLLGVNQHG